MTFLTTSKRALIGAVLAAVVCTQVHAEGFNPGSGAQPVSRGATGRTTLTQNNLLFGNGTAPIGFLSPSGLGGYCVVSDGTSWAARYCLVTGSIIGTAPVTVNVASGAATVALTIDANFAVVSNQLALASIASGNLIANCGASSAEPTACAATTWLDRNLGSTNGMFAARIAGSWTGATMGTGLGYVGSALSLQPASAGTIGGVNSIAQVSNQWVQYIDPAGLPHLAGIANASVSYAMLQNVAALSMVGNCGNTTSSAADVTGTANQVMRVNSAGTGCGFGAIDLSQAGTVGTSRLALANIQNVTADYLLGNFSGSSAAPSSTAIGNCASALTYSTSTHTFSCNNGLGTGSVTSGGGGLVPVSGGPATLYVEQMTPMGRMSASLAGGSVVCSPSTDQVAQTTLYYAPCSGQWVPIYDGTNMQLRQFTSGPTDTVGLSIALGSNWAATTLFDGFVGINGGTVTYCTGPAWSSSGIGTSTRGSGAGTTQLALYKGLWTNAVSMVCRYSNSATFTCGVNQCTYVGTFLTGASAGTIDLKFGTQATGGGSANLSICNYFNRDDVRAAVSDTSSSWSYTSSTWRSANAGSTFVQIVSCMGDVKFQAKYFNLVAPTASSLYQSISIGLNNAALPATRATTPSAAGTSTAGWALVANLDDVSPGGVNRIYAIESSDNSHATSYQGLTSPFNYQQLSLMTRM